MSYRTVIKWRLLCNGPVLPCSRARLQWSLGRISGRTPAPSFAPSPSRWGLLPILVPGVYGHFSPNIRILLESGVAVGAFVAAVLNILFHHARPGIAVRPANARTGSDR